MTHNTHLPDCSTINARRVVSRTTLVQIACNKTPRVAKITKDQTSRKTKKRLTTRALQTQPAKQPTKSMQHTTNAPTSQEIKTHLSPNTKAFRQQSKRRFRKQNFDKLHQNEISSHKSEVAQLNQKSVHRPQRTITNTHVISKRNKHKTFAHVMSKRNKDKTSAR